MKEPITKLYEARSVNTVAHPYIQLCQVLRSWSFGLDNSYFHEDNAEKGYRILAVCAAMLQETGSEGDRWRPDEGRDLRDKLGCGVNVYVEPGRTPLKSKRSKEDSRSLVLYSLVLVHLVLQKSAMPKHREMERPYACALYPFRRPVLRCRRIPEL